MNDSSVAVGRPAGPAAIAVNRPPTDPVSPTVALVVSAADLGIDQSLVWTRTPAGPPASPWPDCPETRVLRAPPSVLPPVAAAPAYRPCETPSGIEQKESVLDSSAPLWVLRRWLAEALQCGQTSLAEGIACMRALDAAAGDA